MENATADEVRPPPWSISTVLADNMIALGDWTLFALHAVSGIFTRHMKFQELLIACSNIGVGSIGVVAITGTFIGMVLAVQAYGEFHQIGLETSLGAVIHMSVVRELGPVLTAVMLAGRVGSAMAAQLGTMRVTEQIDALTCLGVDPVRYLVSTRFLAAVLVIPILTIFADIMGLLGSSFICLKVYGIDAYHYWEHTRAYVGLWDVFIGLTKSMLFGGAIALIACHRGFHCTAGAEGVGKAATEAFVISFVVILALDFVLAMLTITVQHWIWPVAATSAI